MTMMRFCPIFGLLAGAVALLSGCRAIEGDFANVKCPDTGVIGGLGTVSRFDGIGTGFANLAYRASLTKEQSSCSIDAGGVTIMLSLSTLVELGPTAPSRSADFPYFVAVTDDDDRIVAQERTRLAQAPARLHQPRALIRNHDLDVAPPRHVRFQHRLRIGIADSPVLAGIGVLRTVRVRARHDVVL